MFNSSEFHFFGSISYEIHILVEWVENLYCVTVVRLLVLEANADGYVGFNEKRFVRNGNAESFYGKIVKSNENKLVDFRHLEPLCDGRKAAGVRGQCRGLRRLRLCSTRTPCSSKL